MTRTLPYLATNALVIGATSLDAQYQGQAHEQHGSMAPGLYRRTTPWAMRPTCR